MIFKSLYSNTIQFTCVAGHKGQVLGTRKVQNFIKLYFNTYYDDV